MANKSQSSPSQPLSGIIISLTIHQAENLLAKDRNLFGKKTSSDPFVEIYHNGKPLGKTSVRQKTLNPEWNFELKHTFLFNEQDRVFCVGDMKNPSLLLVLLDHDLLSSDDILGQVIAPITTNGFNLQWFNLQTGNPHSKHYCTKTRGRAQLSLQVKTLVTPNMVRGNMLPLHMPKSQSLLHVGLGWDASTSSSHAEQKPIDLDVSCVAVGNNGVLMNETVYFSNLSNPNRSIRHTGDEREGMQNISSSQHDKEQICLDLNRLPKCVAAYILLVTVATPGVDFSQVTSARVRICNGTNGHVLCQYRPAYEGNSNGTALFLLRLGKEKNGSWTLGTIGDCNATWIPEIKSYCRDLLPDMVIDPNERIALMNKGMTVRVRDYCPQRNVLPSVLAFGLAWDVTNGVNIDLDASVICLDAHLNLIDLVYYNHLRSEDGAIHHSGDEREGDEVGDDEKIIIALNSVNPNVEHLVFTINSFTGQELDDVALASCHLFDLQTCKDLARYTLTNNWKLDKHTALIMADLYRDGVTRDWMMRLISHPTQGRTAKNCVGVVTDYLRRVPPAAAAMLPEDEIVLNQTMPSAVPLDGDIIFDPEEEIVFTPPA